MLACLTEGGWPDEARAAGIPAYCFPRTRLRSPSNLRAVVGGLRRVVGDEGVDLIHASENSALAYSGLTARRTGTPVVWHVHSPLQPRSLEERLVARVLPRLRPDHVVYTSAAAQARSVPLGGAASVVMPGVDAGACRAGDPDRAATAFGIPATSAVVSMFARVVPEKGAEVFLEAVGLLARARPELFAVLCGPGDERGPFWRHLERRRHELGIAERFLLPGDVRSPRKEDLVARSALVMHTSPAESFGLSVLEAMAAARPVVAADVDGPRLMIDSGVDGVLVPPGDAAAFARAAAALLDDPEGRQAMGARAARAAERFPITATVGAMEEVWDGVLRRDPAGQRSPSHH